MMTPALESKLFGLGYVLIFGAIFALAGFAYYNNTSYALAIVTLIIGAIVIEFVRNRRVARRLQEALESAFSTFHGTKPSIDERSSHGFPYFILTFRSEADMNKAQAGGHIEVLKAAIQNLYGHCGYKRYPFDVEKAISIKYD